MRRVLLLCACFLLVSCSSPKPEQAEGAAYLKARWDLADTLLSLLPEAEQNQGSAIAEVKWLADSAFRASLALSEQYEQVLPNWMNNGLVNSRLDIKERGLCWQYQHDLYRELRRRPLKHLRIGLCRRVDEAEGELSQHHALYIVAKGSKWPEGIILDPWRHSGILTTIDARKEKPLCWEENKGGTLPFLQKCYGEGHQLPMEHWAMVKSDEDPRVYVPSDSEEGRKSRQGQLMWQQCDAAKPK